MKIGQKLLIAFGLCMAFALLPALFSYREMGAVRKRLRPVEMAGDITSAFLEARKNEKSFLLVKDQDSYQLLRKQISMVKGSIDDIESDIVKEIGSQNYADLRKALTSYEESIRSLSENFKAQQAVVSTLTDSGRQIEKHVSERNLRTVLVLRRHEKNLIISRDSAALSAFRSTLNSVVADSSLDLAPYAAAAERLFGLYQEERSLDAEMKKTATLIQAYTGSILKGEREDIEALLRTSMTLLLLSFGVVIVAGGLISARLALGIAAPIGQIQKFAEGVAAGDYSQTLEIKGSREIVSLAGALNTMAVRLKDTVSSLELAIKNLHEKQGQLVEAEKLASLGRIAAGVAHEINNPLAIINEKAGLMQDILELAPAFEQKANFNAQLEGITASISRCRSITHRLLGFARRVEITIEPLNLNDTVRETVTFLQSDISAKSVHLEQHLSDDLPEIRSDKILLEQVFLNLIKNAVDAVDHGGEIMVTTARKDESTVQVGISDNGPGIPKENLARIFEPFFTTKERGKGTGLGLFVSHAMLRKIGCRIQVQSEPGKGASFLIDVPVRPSLSGEVPV